MKVDMPPVNIITAKLGINPDGELQSYFTEACYKRMDKYVPKDKGALRRTVILEKDKITYTQPYARYIYYGKKMVMPHNNKSAYFSKKYGFWSEPGMSKVLTNEDLVFHTGGTCSYWDKKMVTAEMQDLVREVQNYMRSK